MFVRSSNKLCQGVDRQVLEENKFKLQLHSLEPNWSDCMFNVFMHKGE